MDIVPHALTAARILGAGPLHVVSFADVPNPHRLHPGIPSAGQQAFGDALLEERPMVVIPSVVSAHSWNVIFDPIAAKGLYGAVIQERFALDTASRTKSNVGSSMGDWPKRGGGRTSVMSRPLNMLYGSAVEVDIEDCTLLQAANLLAHSVVFRDQGELGWSPGHLRDSGVEAAYGRLPASVLNRAASSARADVIVLSG